MPNIRRFLQRLVQAFRPDRAEADLQREVASHLALLEDEYRRRGMSPEQAHTEARRTIGGGAEQAKIRHRDARSFVWLDELRTDVKYAVRRLRGRPGASVLAIAMLAIAVGLSTAMFTVVDALIVRPLPFPHADRLAHITMRGPTGGRIEVDAPVLSAWQQSPVFERVEGASAFTGLIEAPAGPLTRQGAVVTPGLFDMLGVRPLSGRLFDTRAPNENEVLLSETFWRTAFQSDETVVGREIRLDNERRVVAGIMPASFRFPEWNTDIWRAGRLAGDQSYRAFVRLAEGVPEEDALRVATEAAFATGAMAEYPSTWRATRRPVVAAGEFDGSYYRQAVPFLAGAVALVVLVLCTNVSSLLLTRLRARRREFGVCTALGASSGRLLRQAVVESVMLGVSGGLVGLVLAWASVSIAAAVLPQAFLMSSLNPLALDLRALLAATTIGLVATCAAGVVPAWLGTRVRRDAGNRAVERHGTETRRGRVTIRSLLIAEVALACVLLIGATLLVRSFVNVARIDRGFDPAGIVTLWFSFDGAAGSTPQDRIAAAATIEEDIKSLPGVRTTAWSSGVPMNPAMVSETEAVPDAPGAVPVLLQFEVFSVGRDFFDLYGVPLLRGRSFVDGESDAAIVGERIASLLWPGQDPLGRMFTVNEQIRVPVVGIAKETRRSVIDDNLDFADVYVPFDGRSTYLTLSLRCDPSCPSDGVLRQRVMTGAGRIVQMTRLDDAFARDLEQPRASAALAGTFAFVALIASAGGLFGVLSYAVQERRREFGIRAAIGATPAAIAKVVFREGAIVGLAGLLIGGALAAALASTLASLSYQVTAFDPLSVVVIVVTLMLTIALALWRPARTAARTDPALLLKEE